MGLTPRGNTVFCMLIIFSFNWPISWFVLTSAKRSAASLCDFMVARIIALFIFFTLRFSNLILPLYSSYSLYAIALIWGTSSINLVFSIDVADDILTSWLLKTSSNGSLSSYKNLLGDVLDEY